MHSSRLITEQKAASPGFHRGVVQNKGIRHSITERHPGRHFAALNRLLCVWADRTIFSLGYTSSWGCSADFRTVLWCVQRQPVSCSSHDNAGERTRTAPSICGPFNSQLPRAVAKPLTSKLRSHYGEIYSARSRRCMDFSRILCTTRFWRGQVGCWRPFEFLRNTLGILPPVITGEGNHCGFMG